MSGPVGTVAVTGASGYLGSRICARFASLGWRVLRLVRRPGPGEADDRPYDLADRPGPDLLVPAGVLVHAAYDLALTRPADVWRVNVEGTRRLLEAAAESGVARIVVLSSMSAYPGTAQVYGRAKLAIEADTLAAAGVVLRPGLVYGEDPGGMVGALCRMARLPVLPLVAGRSSQYPVHEDDLTAAVVAVATAERVPCCPLGAAPPEPVAFRAVLEALAAAQGRHPRFLPVPWQLLYGTLRLGELLHLPLPFRADSLLGLARPAPSVPGAEELSSLGLGFRRLAA